MNLESLSEPELLRYHSAILDELKRRGVIRTRNNPVGDYGEWLVSKKLKLKLAPNATAGFDAWDKYYRRYEIKARRAGKRSAGFSILGIIRNLNFHFLIAVQLNPDFSVYRAYRISHKAVANHKIWFKSLHGWRIVLNKNLLKDRGCKEITEMLK